HRRGARGRMSTTPTPTEPAGPTLIPAARITLAHRDVPLAEFPPNDELMGPAPDRALVDSVRDFGVLDPVLLERHESLRRPYVVRDGRRRIKAARLAGLTSVPAVVLPPQEGLAGGGGGLGQRGLRPGHLGA